MGLGEVNAENATNSKNPVTTEKIQDKSSSGPTNAKQSEKNEALLKEVVSCPTCFFFFLYVI